MAETKLNIVVTDESLLKEITFNYDQIKATLSRKLKKYKDPEVTPDNIQEAKNDRADLNELDGILAERGKEIQLKILGGFDVKIKELRKMIKDTSGEIDAAVKQIEQRVKDKKRKEINQLYEEKIGDLKEVLPIEKIFDDRWLNVTITPERVDGSYNYKKVESALDQIIDKTKNDLSVIDSMGMSQDLSLQIKDFYLNCLDLTATLQEKARLDSAKIKIQKTQDVIADAFIGKPEEKNELDEVDWANVSEKQQECTIVVFGSKKQIDLVKSFLSVHKINFELRG